MMEYKGYIGTAEVDAEAGVIHGEVVNTRDTITFQADTVKALRKAFVASVDDYLAYCAERGEEPDKPFSGKFLVRIAPDLHRRAFIAARHSGKSMNGWLADVVARAAM